MRGYVYALINASLEGLVKVGRTDREPSQRAKELSDHTGVPTPFLVAYQRLVSDTEAAEAHLHTMLERSGYRLVSNREFFNAPLHEIVDLIREYPDSGDPDSGTADASTSETTTPTGDAFLDGLSIADPPPWQEVLDEADAFYFGRGEFLQDYGEALKRYKQAARLGCVQAYCQLGDMYRVGEGATASRSSALEYYKQGAAAGDINCYVGMALLFEQAVHFENSAKCWKRFFDGLRSRIAAGNPIEVEHLSGGFIYLRGELVFGREPLNEDVVDQILDALIEHVERTCAYNREHGLDPSLLQHDEKTLAWLESRWAHRG